MRDDIDALLKDATLTTLLLAIALGWSLYQLAHGVATFVDGLFTHLPPGTNDAFSAALTGGGLTWVVGQRIITLDAALLGVIELAVVLTAALLVKRRRA